MANKKTRKTYDVPVEVFIQVWQTASTADEVAKKLGMPKPIVHARASNYRSAGVKLKKMPRKPKNRLDVPALNRMIAELDAQQRQ